MKKIKEKPIIFGSPMVRAILEGRKTMTRRPMKSQPSQETMICFDKFGDINKTCPYGQVGDHLWVREIFIYFDKKILYYADQQGNDCFKWKPSIHMPREYSRITLEITNIRVERLQDITEEDAKKEGISPSETVEMKDGSPCYTIPFQQIWVDLQGIDNPNAWNQNPWVWVIEFRRI